MKDSTIYLIGFSYGHKKSIIGTEDGDGATLDIIMFVMKW